MRQSRLLRWLPTVGILILSLITQEANAQSFYERYARPASGHARTDRVTPTGPVVCQTPAVTRRDGETPAAAEPKSASAPAEAAPAQAPPEAGPEPAKKAEAAPPAKSAPAPAERAKEAAPAAAPLEEPKPAEKEKAAAPKANGAAKAPATEELVRIRAADFQAATQSAADLGYEVGYKTGYEEGAALGKVRILSREEALEIGLKAAREAIERKKKERK